jgi:hypothetical protein
MSYEEEDTCQLLFSLKRNDALKRVTKPNTNHGASIVQTLTDYMH